MEGAVTDAEQGEPVCNPRSARLFQGNNWRPGADMASARFGLWSCDLHECEIDCHDGLFEIRTVDRLIFA